MVHWPDNINNSPASLRWVNCYCFQHRTRLFYLSIVTIQRLGHLGRVRLQWGPYHFTSPIWQVERYTAPFVASCPLVVSSVGEISIDSGYLNSLNILRRRPVFFQVVRWWISETTIQSWDAFGYLQSFRRNWNMWTGNPSLIIQVITLWQSKIVMENHGRSPFAKERCWWLWNGMLDKCAVENKASIVVLGVPKWGPLSHPF